MKPSEPVNILLIDDQPAKLLSYEAILRDLGEVLIKATTSREAFECLLRHDIAVILVDVCMPELDGFELVSLVRDHPRYQETPVIFVSAIHLTDLDRLRGYEVGAVDYVPVPVVPAVLRAKVRVFAELHRKKRDLERLNADLEQRVAERTAELQMVASSLQESEQRRSLALAAGKMGSWDWDLETGKVTCDDGQLHIFGRDAETCLDIRHVLRIIHPDDRYSAWKRLRTARRGDGSFQIEARMLRGDSDVRWCICSGALTSDSEGRPLRATGVTIDITERKRAEEALKVLNDELEQRIERGTREREHALAQLFESQKLDTIGRLTGGVAHDFNNLLMAVLSSLQLLRKRLSSDDFAMRLVNNAILGAERGSALTRRLLAFARRQELKPVAVNLKRLVSSISDLLIKATGPTIELRQILPEDLADCLVDPHQLELALLNLTINARDAMEQGGSIIISASNESVHSQGQQGELPRGDYVRISVIDNGVGMDEETLARAMEPFFTTKGPGKGTGLGLSMVHGLAAQSGGQMFLHSKIGVGTRIELWLPVAKGDMTSDEAAPSEAALVSTEGSMRVLLVDDDPLVSAGTAAMLEDLGHAVTEAKSGHEALAIIDGGSEFDLVITDQMMPGTTGLQLARILLKKTPGLPVILASGFAEIADESADVLAISRLSKPFSQAQLAQALAAATASHHPPKIRVRS